MPGYFFDTSALAKAYRTELGSDVIDNIAREPGSHRFISTGTDLPRFVMAIIFSAQLIRACLFVT